MSHDASPPHAPPVPSSPGGARPSHAAHGAGEELPTVNVSERGAEQGGQPQVMDRRLFMQFLAFHADGSGADVRGKSVVSALSERGVRGVVYDDVNDPRGLGVLTWSENPAHFVRAVRPVLADPALGLVLRPELTMLGRSYSTGYEQDLRFLAHRPARANRAERGSCVGHLVSTPAERCVRQARASRAGFDLARARDDWSSLRRPGFGP